MTNPLIVENESKPQSWPHGNQYIFNNFPFLNLILKKWWLFLIIGICAGVAGILYAVSTKPQYESRLTFSLDAGSADVGISSAMNLAAQLGFGLGGGQSMFDGDNILEIMKSRRMIENVLLSSDTFEGKPYTLIDYFVEKSEFKDAFSKNPRLKNINFPVGTTKTSLTYLQDSILYNIYIAFSTQYIMASRPDKKLSIYEVKVNNTNEKFTKVFTDRLVKVTSDFYTEITSKKDKETLEILEQRVASLKGSVNSSIDAKASSQDANVNPAFNEAQSPILKQQYNMQAYGEAYKEMFKTLEMARYQYLKKIPLLQIIDNADYPMKKIKTGKIKMAVLFAIYSNLILMLLLFGWSMFRRK